MRLDLYIENTSGNYMLCIINNDKHFAISPHGNAIILQNEHGATVELDEHKLYAMLETLFEQELKK